LIVWPETAVPGNLLGDAFLASKLLRFTDSIRVPIVLGAAEIEKFTLQEPESPQRVRGYNSAFLLRPSEALGTPYRKRRLVPFGEYLPLQGVLQWPKWLVQQTFETIPGNETHLFGLPDGTVFGVLICWENLFSHLARESVVAGARILVQLTNDASFGRTAAPFQHNLASVMRAVENRVPVVIASNSGPSQIIDPYGRIVASVPHLFTEGIVSADIALATGGTVYTHGGDIFALTTGGTLLLLVIGRTGGNVRPLVQAGRSPYAV
jgi:apolipoprotein N-acyltransferase